MNTIMENEIVVTDVKETLVEGSETQISNSVCEPIKNLTQLRNCLENPPQWIKSILPLSSRSNCVVQNSNNDCHYENDFFHPLSRFDSRLTPRTLVCHDMKNGYLEDRYIGSMKVGNGYTFYHWAQIDYFVYFSHHFITIPPLSWINIAHNNGVKILGTLITEWQEGEKICNQILQDNNTVIKFANDLVEITALYKIDGWLLNIENTVESPGMLIMFVKYLTEQLHKKVPGSIIIWYDSVTEDGRLDWQNELNQKNKCFFDVCDGIFLNYTWKEENIINSVKNAKHRYLDVYVGIDVFGRNTFGGGKFNAHVAAEVIRKHKLSIALFAQGWTHETLEKQPEDSLLERFFNRNNAFWASLWQYFYTHPINKLFETYFYTGVDKNWYNLHNQDIQLTKILHPKEMLSEYSLVPTIENRCRCIQLELDENNTTCFLQKMEKPITHHLFSCDIEASGRLLFYLIVKQTKDSIQSQNQREGEGSKEVNLVILTQNQSGSFNKYLCLDKSNNHRRMEANEKKSYAEISPCEDTIAANIPHPFKNEDVSLTAYSINFEPNSRILEIGAEINKDSVCLCGFGILK